MRPRLFICEKVPGFQVPNGRVFVYGRKKCFDGKRCLKTYIFRNAEPWLKFRGKVLKNWQKTIFFNFSKIDFLNFFIRKIYNL